MTGRIQVVVGGQYGSEGKGNVAGELARDRGRGLVAVRVAGPNAGHSAVDHAGRKWAMRQIPVMAVTNPDARLVIAQGSEIDLDVLDREITQLEAAGFSIVDRLYVDRQATLITDDHKAQEGGYGGPLTKRLGSTAKGIGAARAERVWRRAPLWGAGDEAVEGYDTAELMRAALAFGQDVIIEGTQGYALGLHAGHYPQCTSSDCTFTDFLAMAGLNHLDGDVEPWVVLRTFPIRVAGNSGPMYRETDWDTLSRMTQGYVQPEKTTVTQMIRRVGMWDPELARVAVTANGRSCARVALTFFDYWFPELAGQTEVGMLTPVHWTAIQQVEEAIGTVVGWLGTGPSTFIKRGA